jgi:endonuclease/exonuclease/phosphatase family metal-dependent hydrolase
MNRHRFAFLALAVMFLLATPLAAESLRVVSFNVESGGAQPTALAEQLRGLGPVDLWGFSEVQSISWAFTFKAVAEEVAGADYWFEIGQSGGGDRLLILYNQDKLEHLSVVELDGINPGGRVRSPLVAHMRLKSTGDEFLFMLNHLYRSRPDERMKQARQLNEWAQSQTLPVVAVGDYNFDWLSDDDHGRGFDFMTAGGVFDWVRPATIVPTQCDPEFRSVLDFVFTAGAAQQWPATSTILFPQDDYCPDDDAHSDHRPVEAVLEISGEGPDPLAELKAAVARISKDLETVKALIEQLEQ